MEESISVAVRWRPFELGNNEKLDLQKIDDTVMGIGDSTFVFDQIMDHSWTQTDVYTSLVRPMIDKAVEGFDSTVLAYGQTGSGKTFTMGFENNENENDRGVIIRALQDLFNKPNAANMKISISFIEIYNEKAYDLLAENHSESIPAKGHKTSTATKQRVHDINDAIQILSNCREKRKVRPTKMNPNSSRSHAILTIYVAVKQGDGGGERKAALHLVDLAGSEGVRRTSHSGIALKEGNHINQGLLCIAKVIKALSTKAKVIPYRDTILTSALQDSLNLNSYLSMLACISPYKRDYNETMSTLRFLRNAKVMKINPQINAVINEYKKARTPIKQKPAEIPPGNTNSIKKLFRSPYLPPRPSLCYRPSSTTKMDAMSRPSMISRPVSRCPSSLFSEPTTDENILSTTFEMPKGQSSPLASSTVNPSAIPKPASRTQRLMSVDDVNETLSNQFQTLLDSGISRIKNEFEKQMTDWKQMIADMENRMSANRIEVSAAPIVHEAPREIKESPSIASENGDMSMLSANTNENNLTEDEIDVNMFSDDNDENMPPLHEQIATIALSECENDENAAPNVRRSDRISKNQSLLKSNHAEVVPVPMLQPSKKSLSYEERMMQIAQLPREQAMQEHKRFILHVLNTGDRKQLTKLSTIGQKTAVKIWQYRNFNKTGFESIESLKQAPFWTTCGYNNFIRGNNLETDE